MELTEESGEIMRKRKCMIFIGVAAIGFGSIFSGNTKIYAEDNGNEKISNRFLNEKITVLSEYYTEDQTDVVLLKNGELWQVYPKVEKMMDGVKAAETEWFSNSEQRVLDFKNRWNTVGRNGSGRNRNR